MKKGKVVFLVILLIGALVGAGFGIKYFLFPAVDNSIEITVEAEDGGEVISDTGEFKFTPGKNVVFTITPDEGYYIESIEVDDETVDVTVDPGEEQEYTFENITQAHTIQVVFGLKIIEINLISNNPTYEGVNLSYEGDLEFGETITIKAEIIDTDKCEFEHWLFNGEIYSTTLETEVSLERYGVKEFIAVVSVSVDVEITKTLGGANLNELTVQIEGELKLGNDITLTSSLAESAYNRGYEFDGWYMEGVLISDLTSCSILLETSDDISLEVKLRRIAEDVTINYTTNQISGVTLSKQGWAVIGRTVTINVSLSTGYELAYWTFGGSKISENLSLEIPITEDTLDVLEYKAWVIAPGQLKSITELNPSGQVQGDVDFLNWIEPINKGSNIVSYEISFQREDIVSWSTVTLNISDGFSPNSKIADIMTRVYSNVLSGTYKIVAKASGMTDSLPEYIYINSKELVGSKYFSGGDGTEESPYLISNATQLQKINDFASLGKFYKITSNIEFSGSLSSTFKGCLDGDNKTISLIGVGSSNRTLGLFNIIGENSQSSRNVIKNLNIDLKKSISFGYVYPYWSGGILARSSYKTDFINCKVFSSNMSLSNMTMMIRESDSGINALGGLVGIGYEVNLNGCESKVIINVGSVSSTSDIYVGGLVGYSVGEEEDLSSFINCKNYTKFNLTGSSTSNLSYIDYLGGIIGYAVNINFVNCENSNVITQINSNQITTYNSELDNVGGIVGYAEQSQFNDCLNKSNFIGIPLLGTNTKMGNIGGVIGYLKGNTTINNCINEGLINTSQILTKVNVGGIIGYSYDNVCFDSCQNKANITVSALDIVGSLIGEGRLIVQVLNCSNTASVIGGFSSDTSVNRWYGRKGS